MLVATDLQHAGAAADLREFLYWVRQALRDVEPASGVLRYAAAFFVILARCALQARTKA